MLSKVQLLSNNLYLHHHFGMVTEVGVWQRFLSSEKQRVEALLKEQHGHQTTSTKHREVRVKRSDFVFYQVLGKGGFGEVRLLRHKTLNTWHAAKILLKSAVISKGHVSHVNNERNMLGLCDMPFIVHLFFAFQDATHLFLVMEFLPNGDLFSLLRHVKHFNEPLARFFGGQILLALEYLHSLGIIHRDVKPENIMIKQNGYLKLVDFGFAKLVKRRTYTFCGTPEYLAPEILLHRGYCRSVDWWAFGILLFEIFYGRSPFVSSDVEHTYANILGTDVTFPKGVAISDNLKHIIVNLLHRDISQRFGSLREGPLEIRRQAWFDEIDWCQLFQQKLTPPYDFSVTNLIRGTGEIVSKQHCDFFKNF